MADDPVIDEPLEDALSGRYLAYALSTITSRALPDVRDGLKPVHRRLLYAMRQLRLASSDQPKKSARVVGDVIGRLHPHGDRAVYDALVRLAQDFSLRHRLIDGQGNFGNLDGDGAAAMRYTEARLTAAAESLLDGLDDDAVGFRPTYDDQESEPEVLPAGFPNLLVNGASGIAVGIATSIPPHNGAEAIDACLVVLGDDTADLEDVLAVLPGPDFPTGGLIAQSAQSIREIYAVGRGVLIVQARWHTEEQGSRRWVVVVTEIPFQVQKARLIEQLAKVIVERKVAGIADVRDESTDVVRIVVVPRTVDVDADQMMESLFATTDLEVRMTVNMTALAGGRPRVLGLMELLSAYLAHRRDVVQRRTRCRLERAQHRLSVVRALQIVYADMDEVIELIRRSDEPKTALTERFGIDSDQAEAILNMRLRALRGIEEIAIRTEYDQLVAQCAGFEKLLSSTPAQWTEVKRQLKKIRGLFDPKKNPHGARRTGFTAPAARKAVQVVAEPIRIVLSQRGWIRALRQSVSLDSLTFREGDALALAVDCQSSQRVTMLGSNGRAYGIDAHRIPRGRGQGEPVRLFAGLAEDACVIALFVASAGCYILASARGSGFIVDGASLVSHKKGGRAVVTLRAEDELKLVRAVTGDQCALIGTHRKLIVVPTAMIPQRDSGRGVRLMALPENEEIADIALFDAQSTLEWSDAAGRRRRFADWRHWSGRRGGTGRAVPKGFNANGRFDGVL